jgi:hypothetical protein
MKESCALCTHYEAAKNNVGYCTFLGVMLEKGVAILDANLILQAVRDSVEQKIFNFVVVQASFGCTYYKKVMML